MLHRYETHCNVVHAVYPVYIIHFIFYRTHPEYNTIILLCQERCVLSGGVCILHLSRNVCVQGVYFPRKSRILNVTLCYGYDISMHVRAMISSVLKRVKCA